MKVTKAALTTLLAAGVNLTQQVAAASTPGKMKLYLVAAALLGSVGKVSSQNFPFVQFGTSGVCLGANGMLYKYVQAPGGALTFSESNPQPCIDYCLQANVDKLVGVSIKSSTGCQCQLTDATGVSGTDYTPNGAEAFGTSGTGNVENTCTSCGVSWAQDFTCFRNEVSCFHRVEC